MAIRTESNLSPVIEIVVGASPDSARQASSIHGGLAALSLSMLLSSLGTSIANVALPSIAQAFNASFQEVQWVVIAYLLAITTLIVSAGRLSDKVGRRRLLLAGIALFTAASFVCGAAPALGILIAARAGQGLGAAVMMALSMAMVGENVAKARMGSAMGLLGTMSAVGTALGPSLGGALISGLGWRSVFMVNAPLGALAIIAAYRFLPDDQAKTKISPGNFDLAGTALLALTLAAYALAMTIGRGSFGPINGLLLLAAGLGVALFLLVEVRTDSPLLPEVVFCSSKLRSGLALSACVSMVIMTTMVVGPFYLSYALGLDAARVGFAMTAGPLVVALAGVFAGRVADHFGTQPVTIAGLFGIAVGSMALALIPLSFGVPGYIAPVLVLTIGYALFQTANNTAVMMDVQPDQRGVVSGMLNLSRNLGLITGASVMGAVFTFASGATDFTSSAPQDVAVGMRMTFAVAALAIVIALAVSVSISNRAVLRQLRNRADHHVQRNGDHVSVEALRTTAGRPIPSGSQEPHVHPARSRRASTSKS